MVDAMANAELHIVNGGHAPWLRHPEQVAPVLTTFLERVSPSTPS